MKRRMTGMLYAEVLVAVALLALALVPATNALYAGLRAQNEFVNTTADHLRMIGRLEELSAEPFAALDAAATAAGAPTTATTYSDPAGPGRRLIYLWRYDADDADADGNPFTGTEDGLIWVRVEIEGTNRGIETLISR